MGARLQRHYVGRGRQTAALDREFERAARGEFRCVLISGKPGIGKSRLANEFLKRKGTAATGLTARGHALGSGTAFGLWAEAIDQHVRGRSADQVRELCGGLIDDLAGLLRTAAALYGGWRSDVAPARLCGGMATLLSNVAREHPVVVVLDDAHLADASSWEALGYLAENLSDIPILVLAVLRLRELPEGSAGWRVIVSLEQDGVLSRLNVPRLRREDLGELAGRAIGRATPPATLVEWLDHESHGNPLFAGALLDALVGQGADPEAPELDSTPLFLADWIRTRLHELNDPARELAEVLAVVGRQIDLTELRGFSHHRTEVVEDALRALMDVGLVTEHRRATNIGYEISHPLVQDTIYDDMDAARRRAQHRRMARASTADRPDEAALHFARAAAPGDAEAITAVIGALRHTWSQQTYPEAFQILRAIAELIPAGDRRWLDVLDALPLDGTWTAVYNRINIDVDAGIRTFREIDRVLGASDAADPGRRASVQLRLAGLLGWGRGEIEEATTLLSSAQEMFGSSGSAEWSLVAANELSWMYALAARYPKQAESASWTLSQARELGDATVEMLALGSLGNAEYVRGRFADAEAALRRNIELALDADEVGRLAYGLAVLGVTFALEGRMREGQALVDEAFELRAASADPLALGIRTQMAYLAGDIPLVLELGAKLLALYGGILQGWPAAWLSAAAVEAGDLPLAHRYAGTSSRILTRRLWMMKEDLDRALGLASWAQGDLSDAVSRFKAAAVTLLDDGAIPYAAFLLVDLAEAALDADDVSNAQWAADRSADVAERIDRDHYRGCAALTAACAALAAGEREGAVKAAREAAERFDGSGYRALEARSLGLLGQALAPSERPIAISTLRRAGDLFSEFGASWRRDRILTVLDDLGKPGRRAAAALRGPGALTHREREVATLAAQGLTAKRIGAELHIGTRTVETHLAHAYAKLGVRSRVELARALEAVDDSFP